MALRVRRPGHLRRAVPLRRARHAHRRPGRDQDDAGAVLQHPARVRPGLARRVRRGLARVDDPALRRRRGGRRPGVGRGRLRGREQKAAREDLPVVGLHAARRGNALGRRLRGAEGDSLTFFLA